jgi:hypothetical protein
MCSLYPARLPFFKCILDVVFCEGVQHCLWFFLSHLNYVKLAGYRKITMGQVGWLGDGAHDILVKNTIVKKEVLDGACRVAITSSFVIKFHSVVFIYFHVIALKCYSSMQNWYSGLSGWILWEQSPWSQRKSWATLNFALHLSFHFLSLWVRTFHLCSSFFLP